MEDVKHYLANGAATSPAAREALDWAGQTRAEMVDLNERRNVPLDAALFRFTPPPGVDVVRPPAY